MKASLFLFSVLAAIAAASTNTDVVNYRPSPTVQEKTKTIQRKANDAHEADSSPTVLEERDPAITQREAATSVDKREPVAVTEREVATTGDVGE